MFEPTHHDSPSQIECMPKSKPEPRTRDAGDSSDSDELVARALASVHVLLDWEYRTLVVTGASQALQKHSHYSWFPDMPVPS